MKTTYEQQLAEQFKVSPEKVSSARTELTNDEKAANEYQDTAIKAQVILNGQKKAVCGGIAI